MDHNSKGKTGLGEQLNLDEDLMGIKSAKLQVSEYVEEDANEYA